MKRTGPTIVFAASLVTLVLLGLAYRSGSPASDAGDIAAVEASLSRTPDTTSPLADRASPPPAQPAPSLPASAPATPRPEVAVWSGRLDPSADTAAVPPVGLRLPTIRVDAPVVAMGVDPGTGEMAVPRNVRDVAWYEFGPRPGEPGSAVLAAHVDLAGRGPGTFFRLRELDPGDTVEVDFADGSSRLFRVQARTVYSKADLPLDTIFAEGGASVLTLITCGGGFDRSTGSYDSNVVVYAVPVAEVAATFAR